MTPPERDLSTKWYYQIIQSRYGFNPHHLMLADACEFFIGQGCKVGLGGHLMGQKVTEQVAEMRSLPAGIDQRSPARHPDWLGPDDLSLKVQEVREATDYQIILGDVGPGLGDSMYDGTIYVGGTVKSLGIDCVEGEWTDADTELIDRKFRIYGLGDPPQFQKFVCGKKLYNYDSLEPSERKLVL